MLPLSGSEVPVERVVGNISQRNPGKFLCSKKRLNFVFYFCLRMGILCGRIEN